MAMGNDLYKETSMKRFRGMCECPCLVVSRGWHLTLLMKSLNVTWYLPGLWRDGGDMKASFDQIRAL